MGWFSPSKCQFCGAPLGRTYYKIATTQGRKTVCARCHSSIARQASKNAITDISERRTPRAIDSEKHVQSGGGRRKKGGSGCGCLAVIIIVGSGVAFWWFVIAKSPSSPPATSAPNPARTPGGP